MPHFAAKQWQMPLCHSKSSSSRVVLCNIESCGSSLLAAWLGSNLIGSNSLHYFVAFSFPLFQDLVFPVSVDFFLSTNRRNLKKITKYMQVILFIKKIDKMMNINIQYMILISYLIIRTPPSLPIFINSANTMNLYQYYLFLPQHY